MFVHSIISFQDTFTRAKNWVKELQRQASPNIVIALAGNKADLANKRAVDFQVCVHVYFTEKEKGTQESARVSQQTCLSVLITSTPISLGSADVCR